MGETELLRKFEQMLNGLYEELCLYKYECRHRGTSLLDMLKVLCEDLASHVRVVRRESDISINLLGANFRLHTDDLSRVLATHDRYKSQGIRAVKDLVRRYSLSTELALKYYVFALITPLEGLCSKSKWTREVARDIYTKEGQEELWQREAS